MKGGWMDSNSDVLVGAILRTLAYAGVFDYPLRLTEMHRYLVGEAVLPDRLESALREYILAQNSISQVDGYFTLRGREDLVQVRRLRQRVSAGLWPRAVHYGGMMSGLPFVRMVAITGALAMGNVAGRVDMDYLVVTRPGRLWACRALVILLVRWAGLQGDTLCPNYLVTEEALSISDRNLYTAHELVQMVPLSGLPVYRRMRLANRWTEAYLPNAVGAPPPMEGITQHMPGVGGYGMRPLWQIAESALGSPAGDWRERWEMERKIRKLSRGRQAGAEVDFSADWCKGHFDSHGQRTMAAYEQRLVELGLSGIDQLERVPVKLPVGVPA